MGQLQSPFGLTKIMADTFKNINKQANATADQTGTEIVSAIDTELGQTDWKNVGNIGAATTTLANAISGVSQLDLSTTHNHIITLNANTDTSHYDYSGLTDGDIIYMTFTNSSGSTKTITFNTNDVAPQSTLNLADGKQIMVTMIKQSTTYRYSFGMQMEAI
jgi:hypothetical protein